VAKASSSKKGSRERQARHYFIGGRVQGVGYRWFVERLAAELRLTGYTRNLDDGRVEVYAVGTAESLEELGSRLRLGPRLADVRHVQESEAAVVEYFGFNIKS
jgi:acylphosphatase